MKRGAAGDLDDAARGESCDGVDAAAREHADPGRDDDDRRSTKSSRWTWNGRPGAPQRSEATGRPAATAADRAGGV